MGLFRKKRPRFDANAYDSILDACKKVYKANVKPLEETHLVAQFGTPLLNDADFDAKPMVMMIGSYSTGKTTFIKFLLERDVQGMHIGPEPTTDRFHVIMHGNEDRELPGHTLVSDTSRPFHNLSQFGNSFLSRIVGCEVNSPFAQGCTIIDTPGILAGRKQTDDRQYSFENVVRWFAPRVDMILLMFDAHKVDISDEFRSVIQAVAGYDDKLRVVMNKADSLEPTELLRINSALAWSLSRILRTPEVVRVYVGSFWDEPLVEGNFLNDLFETEMARLIADLNSVPRNNTLNKVNDLIVRTRRVRVQSLILHQLRSEMPKLGSKDKKQRELIAGLEEVFFKVMKQHSIPAGDFPDVHKFRNTLANHEACRDFSKFKKVDEKLLAQLDALDASHIPRLMQRFEQIPAGGLEVSNGSSYETHAISQHDVQPPLKTIPNRAALPAPSADPWATLPQPPSPSEASPISPLASFPDVPRFPCRPTRRLSFCVA